MHLNNPIPPLLALLALSQAGAYAAKPRDAILLSQVESLTLRGDKQTAHRRVAAIPQLQCISHRNICAKYAIDLMRCENKGAGYDTEDIQWSCTAQLPPELKLGSTDVICEGYSSPDDPYVLKGSCGVEYRMVLTRAGEEKWPDLGSGGGGGGSLPSVDRVFPILFWVIFVAVLGYIVVSACRAIPDDPARPRAARRNNGGGGGGGGGGDDWDDPPPPYPGLGGGRGGGGRGGGGRKTTNSGKGGSGGNAGSTWQSNLMSGAAGAAAGYYAGSRGRNNNTSNAAPNYGSTWGGSGGAGPSRSGSSGSSSGSAASTSRHESTGFGSTSRR